jgi:selenoprotein W-related protein
LTAKLLSQFKQQIAALKLIPSDGGRFEIKANGEQIYSKLETGRFPEEQAIVKLVSSRLKKKP